MMESDMANDGKAVVLLAADIGFGTSTAPSQKQRSGGALHSNSAKIQPPDRADRCASRLVKIRELGNGI